MSDSPHFTPIVVLAWERFPLYQMLSSMSSSLLLVVVVVVVVVVVGCCRCRRRRCCWSLSVSSSSLLLVVVVVVVVGCCRRRCCWLASSSLLLVVGAWAYDRLRSCIGLLDFRISWPKGLYDRVRFVCHIIAFYDRVRSSSMIFAMATSLPSLPKPNLSLA